MIRYISLLLVWLLCVTSQSVNNSDGCNNPPTYNCNCGCGLGSAYDTREELQHLKAQVQNLISFHTNCYNLKRMGFRLSGVYDIVVDNKRTKVYCDMETDGGGWTVIQRRISNETDFFKEWRSYKLGFGNLYNNFWLGLETIHAMTSSGSYQLRVDLEDFSNNKAYALYGSFSIGNEASNYQLHVSGYSGTAGDSMKLHNNYPFTTKDRDNDSYKNSCAAYCHGAWWYKHCYDSNLNGKYYSSGVSNTKAIAWGTWRNLQSLKRVEMKIKPN